LISEINRNQTERRKSKMARGGRREGAGRKRGIRTKTPKSRLLAAEAQARAQGAGITPLEFLCNIYRDEAQPQAVRIAAAEAAMPYMHPKLSAVMASVEQRGETVSPEEKAAKEAEARRLAIEAFDRAFGERTPSAQQAPPTLPSEKEPEPIPREFAREAGPVEVDRSIARLPPRRRRPWPVGSSWSA
jgi:hypothetical protein